MNKYRHVAEMKDFKLVTSFVNLVLSIDFVTQ